MYKFQFKNDDEPFDSIEEFIDNLERGGEIEFTYQSKKYAITHHCEKLVFNEAYNEASQKFFDNVDELLNHQIGDERIRDIVTLIQPFFRCF